MEFRICCESFGKGYRDKAEGKVKLNTPVVCLRVTIVQLQLIGTSYISSDTD